MLQRLLQFLIHCVLRLILDYRELLLQILVIEIALKLILRLLDLIFPDQNSRLIFAQWIAHESSCQIQKVQTRTAFVFGRTIQLMLPEKIFSAFEQIF